MTPSLMLNRHLFRAVSFSLVIILSLGLFAQPQGVIAEANRYHSFAPIRNTSTIHWLVDGHDYFEASIEAILSAKSYMYLSAWWISPEVYLRRPAHDGDNEKYRFDHLLKQKAEEGVDIYVVLYKALVSLGSTYVKHHLEGLHPRIHVIRSPIVPLVWSFHEKFLTVDGKRSLIGGFDYSYARWDTYHHGLSDYSGEMFPGQEYSNPRVHDFEHVENPHLTLVNRTLIPRMPWHDISMSMEGGLTFDLERHFVERWNFIRQMEVLSSLDFPILPLPSAPTASTKGSARGSGQTNQVQVVRSASYWNMDLEKEDSYYQAHLDMIAEAEHYIYIENQYFISSTDDSGVVVNKVAKAIVDRIILAHRKRQKFKVIVVLPILPAFQGDLTKADSNAVRSIMYLQYASISRNKGSVHHSLIKAGINPSDYIEWYSLRTYDKIAPPLPPSHKDAKLQQTNDTDYYVTEMVYIHSKVMIVDDRKALVGSANINDRSLLGGRDAEVGGVVEDTNLVPSYMGDKRYMAGKSILEFRLRLWKEHLGLMDVKDWTALRIPGMARKYLPNPDMIERRLLDPLSTKAYQTLWRDRAKQNTLLYRELFQCVPDDSISTYAQHTAFVADQKKTPYGHLVGYNKTDTGYDAASLHHKLNQIHGHLVQFPLDYLNQSNMVATNIIQFFTPIAIFA